MQIKQMLAAGALVVGMGAGGYGIAHAATSSTTSPNAANATNSTNSASSAPAPRAPANAPRGNPLDPHHAGPGETLLTGDKAAKATAAAKAAVPGATIIRVETDAKQGATYEAHVTKRDGSDVTVLMDGNFKVTSIVPFGPGACSEHGGPPPTGPAPTGQAPTGQAPSA